MELEINGERYDPTRTRVYIRKTFQKPKPKKKRLTTSVSTEVAELLPGFMRQTGHKTVSSLLRAALANYMTAANGVPRPTQGSRII